MAIKISHDLLDLNSSISPHLIFLNKDFKTGNLKRDTGIQLMLMTAFNSNRFLSQNMIITRPFISIHQNQK